MSQAKLTRNEDEKSRQLPALLSMNEVMERLNIGRTTLRTLIDRDEDFVTVKIGYRRLMSTSALEAFVAAKEAEARAA